PHKDINTIHPDTNHTGTTDSANTKNPDEDSPDTSPGTGNGNTGPDTSPGTGNGNTGPDTSPGSTGADGTGLGAGVLPGQTTLLELLHATPGTPATPGGPHGPGPDMTAPDTADPAGTIPDMPVPGVAGLGGSNARGTGAGGSWPPDQGPAPAWAQPPTTAHT
ncbi:hypothetical protein MMF96_19425, partial [Arthrobacter sp. STN4]|nr:hypothetical protein [Arthrobacter sp. STN4]